MPGDLPFRMGLRTGLVRWLVLLCAIAVLLAVGLILRAKTATGGLAMPLAADETRAAIALWLGLQAALFVALLVWMHAAVTNAAAQSPDSRRIGPWMAVAWWFVPVFNFFQPVRAMSQTWNTSVDGGADINGAAAAPVAGWWLLAAIGVLWLPSALQALLDAPGLSEALGRIGAVAGALLAWIGAMGCLANCVGTIGRAQRARESEPLPARSAQPAME